MVVTVHGDLDIVSSPQLDEMQERLFQATLVKLKPSSTTSGWRRYWPRTNPAFHAWWRTGFTAIAVSLAVGRVLPVLAPHSTRWPYVVIGVGFGLYGIALIAYGTRRIAILNAEIGVPPQDRPALRSMAALAVVGVLLGIGTIVLILVQ